IRVLDANGHHVSGARVQVEQVRHAFLFGCNLFNLEPENPEAWQTQYQRQFTALFNYATLPFYWGAFEPEAGRPQYARLEQMARWCTAHGIVAKGHPLIWQEVWPGWAPADPDAAIPLLQRRVETILSRYRGLIRYWDVVNEANSAADHANGHGAWVRRDGPVAVVARALEWARKASRGTDNVLIYNDFNVGEAHLALLEGLQRRRALPDAIGLQSHMHRELWSPERVWVIMERFARFKKPIHFTEITVVSGPSPGEWSMQRPPSVWPTTPEGEREQAEYLERLYTLLFSHPAVQAITYWDFSDRNAWLNAPAGLLRADMTPKPAYERLYNLIRRAWWTSAEGRTGSNGQYTVHAFYGEHRITVTDAAGRTIAQTVTLRPGRGETRVTMQLR
ncbi:MAG: endo-1,4-beta-xylanase, partial [Chloroherpetonaceae bacterium]|nr:endo-1,4-beta-xylanase [Chthonomonadaceae bacterium]MDW8206547.1 endo-1,4-beta-xylanase [Chloroherpetonaceae bacterium]